MENNVLEFECIGLNNGGKFPIENTGRGKDISPEFIIQNLSKNAVALMITLEDLCHPIKGFTHWIIWNIPARDKITKAIPSGSRQSLENKLPEVDISSILKKLNKLKILFLTEKECLSIPIRMERDGNK